jgi:transmembrane sensor
MTHSSSTAREAALNAAAIWLIRLGDADLRDDEIDAWQVWMEASPEHVRAFEDLQLLWDAAGEVDREQVVAAMLATAPAHAAAAAAEQAASDHATVHATAAHVQPAIPLAATPQAAGSAPPASITSRHSARPRSRLRRISSIAAGVAVVAVVAWGALHRSAPPPAAAELRYAAGVGQPRTVALSDGSTLQLDAGSEVVVQYSSQRRQLELLRGQAYFAVAKDASRPFEVRADGAMAQALGTHFSVSKRSDSVRVVVTEGHVQVSDLRAHPNGASNTVIRLVANQAASLVNAGQLEGPQRVDANSAVAWLQGKVIYRGEPLGNVVADLNRYSQVPVLLEDRALAALPVTGRWSTANVDTWLESIAQVLSLQVVRRDGRIVLAPSPGLPSPGRSSPPSASPR